MSPGSNVTRFLSSEVFVHVPADVIQMSIQLVSPPLFGDWNGENSTLNEIDAISSQIIPNHPGAHSGRV